LTLFQGLDKDCKLRVSCIKNVLVLSLRYDRNTRICSSHYMHVRAIGLAHLAEDRVTLRRYDIYLTVRHPAVSGCELWKHALSLRAASLKQFLNY